ncbi:MAG: hypothetical protein JWM80_1933 [Cyanobacteria bacterium RYN_339]|nr:hypothetical protein [Cyanobacteria bacterium RYN_339]
MTSQAYLFLVIGVCVLGAAYQTQTGWLYIMGAMSLGLVLLSWAGAWWNRRGTIARVLPPVPGYAGGTVSFPVAVERIALGPALGLQVLVPAGERIPRWIYRGHLVPAGWANQPLPPVSVGKRQAVELPLTAPCRGEFPLPTFHLQSAFPLGLVALTRPVTAEGRYLVFPVGPALQEVPWLAATVREQGLDQRFAPGHGTSPRGVREYRSGDAWRQVHWRTTARLGKPYIKETEREQGEALTIYLDMRPEIHTAATVEHLVQVATSLMDYLVGAGREVALATQPEATPKDEGGAQTRQLAWLARVNPATGAGLPQAVAGAILLSPAYVAGWQRWASFFVYCPGDAANAMDATAFCPVGMPIPEALGQQARA